MSAECTGPASKRRHTIFDSIVGSEKTGSDAVSIPTSSSRVRIEPLFDELDIEARLTLYGLLGSSHCLIEQLPFPPVVYVSRSMLDVEPIVDERSDGPSVFSEVSINDLEHAVFHLEDTVREGGA